VKGRAQMWMSSWRVKRVRRAFAHTEEGIRRRFRPVRDLGMPIFLSLWVCFFGMLFLYLVRDGWVDRIGMDWVGIFFGRLYD